MKMDRQLAALTMIATSLACAPTEDHLEAPASGVAFTTQGVCAGDCNASVVSDTFPATMDPDEKYNATVTMQNTGGDSWDTTNFVFYRENSNFPGWVFENINTLPVNTGGQAPFEITFRAPSTAGARDFSGRMVELGAPKTFFGDIFATSITVQEQQRFWDCAYVSGVPAAMNPSERRQITLTIQNTGTETWVDNTLFCLRSKDDLGEGNLKFWTNNVCSVISNAPVAPGQNGQTTITIDAPGTPGTYQFLREMVDGRGDVGIAAFRDAGPFCIDSTITVNAGAPLDALWDQANSTFSATMSPGETQPFTLRVLNTGTDTWTATNQFFLHSRSSPASFWGDVNDKVDVATATNESFDFTLIITAPMVAGDYDFHFDMLKSVIGFPKDFFGEPTVQFTLTVAAGPSATDASVASQTIPQFVHPGEATEFVITMNNTGTDDWVGNTFGLNAQNGTFTPTFHEHGACSPTPGLTGQCTFTFMVSTAAAPGVYSSDWRMHESGGVGDFGDNATTAGITVTNCGNGTLDVGDGETCDDDNNTNGDGCSDACVIEAVTIDLNVTAADRSITGAIGNKILANNIVADVDDDNVPDVLVASIENLVVGGRARNQAGRVVAYQGGTGFFNDTDSVVPTGSLFEIAGGDPSDRLGGGPAAGMAVADVTGDGINDVIVSAPDADGVGDARASSGEVYVLVGGASLAGFIDLGASPAHAALGKIIYGAAAGDAAKVLAVGDMDGDTVADIIIGSPGDDNANGADAGSVSIVYGGGDLATAGAIDLLNDASVSHILGGVAGEILGSGVAAVGDFAGTANADLLVGNARHSANGDRSGGAWAFQGPIAPGSSLDIALGSQDTTWLGAEAYDRLGSSVAIGQVNGSATGDALIGVPRLRTAGVRRGSLDVWTGPVAAGTNDLSAAATPGARVLGRSLDDSVGPSLAIGDMNGDGFDDFPVVSSQGDGPGDARDGAGEFQIVLGAADLGGGGDIDLNVVGVSLLVYGAESRDLLGHYPMSTSMGDINNDGRADICIGGPKAGGATAPGRVHCIESAW